MHGVNGAGSRGMCVGEGRGLEGQQVGGLGTKAKPAKIISSSEYGSSK